MTDKQAGRQADRQTDINTYIFSYKFYIVFYYSPWRHTDRVPLPQVMAPEYFYCFANILGHTLRPRKKIKA